ncbi:3'-5' exonuclease family protein [Sphingomonas hengshuiensis]|uniref:Transcriptional regulator n=1 Tax=Sphingomonas hengshuiensis TaxID=1609977 RepID=A0A7U4LF78_9SPHN|nr:transcriptional regulator [Sphingomonas hengshuiensis]AJP72249.1 transcriptional regulator [Sphingomonas hengshuiensis]
MLVFLDFEASSLSPNSYPIEVGWVFEDGRRESHLICPALGWHDWDAAAEAVHHIPRATLLRDGTPHDWVARRMVEVLAGHDLRASAPSWDGKWLGVLLHAAGLPRHALRLRGSDDACVEAAAAVLSHMISPEDLGAAAGDCVTLFELRERRGAPAHRALPDAEADLRRWQDVRAAAIEMAGRLRAC